MNQKPKIPKWFKETVPEEIYDGTIFKFTILTSKEPVQVDMLADIGIDYDNIIEELQTTPSQFSYWSAMLSELKYQVNRLELHIKAYRGKLTKDIVLEITKAGCKPTDKQVLSIIESDETLIEYERKMLILQKQLGKMYFMVDAIKMKCDNLRSLAGFAKLEYTGS